MKWAIPFLLFFCALPAHATITYAQSAQGGNTVTNSLSVAFGSNNTAGCLIVVTVGSLITEAVVNTPTDTQGDTFLPLNQYYYVQDFGTNAYVALGWYSLSCKGGANTVTVTSADNWYGTNMIVAEYDPTVPGTATLDQQAVWPCGTTSNTGTAGVIATPPNYTSNATELVVGYAWNPSESETLSASSPYTLRIQGGGGTNNYEGTLALADFSATTRGAYSTTFSGATGPEYAGAASFSESGGVITPTIEQLACGDGLQPWGQLGLGFGDMLLGASKSGDYIFVGYRSSNTMTPTISDTNSYSWTSIQTSSNYALWYAVVPMDEAAGDIITFGNIYNNNASRLVELHGLSGLPALSSSSDDSTTMSLSLAGYTTPAYCTASSPCTAMNQWYGTMFNTNVSLKDFLIFAENAISWPINTIPGTSAHAGTDLFPTDLSSLEVWLPGAPSKIRHRGQVY